MHEADWLILTGSDSTDGCRLEIKGQVHPTAQVRSSMFWDHDHNLLVVWYKYQDAVLSIIPISKYLCLHPDRLGAQRFRYRFRLSSWKLKARKGDDIRVTSAGSWLMCWLHYGGRGAVVRRRTSPHTDLRSIRMHAEVWYGPELSVKVNR